MFGQTVSSWLGATSGNWSNAANWSPSGVPATGNLLFYNVATGNLTNINDLVGGNFAGLTFNSTAGAYILTGNVFTTTGNITDLSGNTETLNLGINLAGAGATPIIFNGTAGNLLVGGLLSDSGGGLTKAGTGGTLTLNGTSSTYTGTTTVSAGTLVVGGNALVSTPGPLGNSSAAVILGDANTTAGGNTSASLLVNGAFTIARPITVASQNTTGTYTLGGSTNATSTFSGLITMNEPLTISQVATTNTTGVLNIKGGVNEASGVANLTLNDTGPIVFSTAAISNSGSGVLSVIQAGGNQTTFNVANTYSGNTTVNAGTLLVGVNNAIPAASNLTVNGGSFNLGAFTDTIANLTMTGGTLTGTTGNNLTVSGTNGITVSNTNISANLTGSAGLNQIGLNTTTTLSGTNTYTGTTTITTGNLNLDFTQTTSPASNIIGNTSLVMGSGATVTNLTIIGSNSTATTQSFATLTANTGAAKINVNPGTGQTATLTIYGTPVRPSNITGPGANVGGTVQFSTTGSVILPNDLSSALLTDAEGNPFATFGKNDWAATNGSGNLLAAAYTNVTGGSVITDGVNDNITGSAAGSVTGSNPASIRFGNSSGTATLALNGSTTNTLRGILVPSTSTGAAITGATIVPNVVGGATGQVPLTVIQNSNANLTISSVIADNGTPTAVVKSGSGNLVLAGTNTYTGDTFVNEGIVSISSDANLGNPATPSQVDGQNGILQAINTFTLDNSGANPRNLVTNGLFGIGVTTGNTLTVDGVVSGAGSLNKVGNGTLVLDGTNTYTGNTAINAGTLKLDFTGATAPASNIISPSSPLTTSDGTLNMVGVAAGTSVQSFNGTNINPGTTIITAGPTSGITNTTNLNLGNLTVNPGGAIEFIGPAAGAATGNSTATANITTATTSGSTGGALISPTASTTAAVFATVGLYDWAAVTNTTTIVGGNTVTGFYTVMSAGGNLPNAGDNVDITGAATLTVHNTTSFNSIRFNTNVGANITATLSTTVTTTGGILVTPNMGPWNVLITGTAFEPARNGAGSSETVIWQNNTEGILSLPNLGNGKTGAGYYVQSGPGTVFYGSPSTAPNGYTGQTFLNGGFSVANATSSFGSTSTPAAVELNGGTVVANATFTMDNGNSTTGRPFVLLGSGGTLSATGPSTLTIDGVISGVSGTGPLQIGFTGNAAGTGTYNSIVTPNAAVTGNGTIVLTGANTYTGGTVINAGTLSFNGNSLGSGGVTFNGGTLIWNGTTTDITAGNVVTFNAGGGNLNVGTNNVTFNAPEITGTGSLTKLGTGKLTMGSGVTAPSGGVNVNAGTLEVVSGAQLNSGAVTATGGTLSVDTSSTIGGAVTLGTNSSLTLGLAGTVSGNFVALTLSSSLTLNSNSTFNFALSSSSGNDSIFANSLTLNGGVNSVGFNLYLPNGNKFQADGTYDLITYDGSLGGTGNVTSFKVLNAASGTSYTFNTATVGEILLTVAALTPSFSWNTTSGNWSLGSNWTPLNGNIAPPNGVAQVATFDTTGAGGNAGGTVTVDQPITVGTINLNNSANPYTIAPDSVPDNLTLDNGNFGSAIIDDQAGNHTISAPILLNSALAVSVDTAGNTLTISGGITDNGTNSLTMSGTGTLDLSGTNTYLGGTTINGGTLNFTNGALSTGSLTMNGGTLQWATGNTQDISTSPTRTVTIGAGGATFDNNGQSIITIGGPIGNGGSGSLTLVGSGTFDLAGANTFTGAVNLNGGIVQFTALNNLGAGTTINFNGGTLQWLGTTDISSRTVNINSAGATLDTNGQNVALASSIGNAGSGSLTKAGNGNLTLDAVETYTGNTTVNGGTVILGIANALPNTALTVNTGAFFTSNGFAQTVGSIAGGGNIAIGGTTLTVDGTGTGNFTGNLDGTGTLTEAGVGTTTLSGVSTFNGTLNVTSGTVAIGASGNFGALSTLNTVEVTSGGTFQLNGGNLTATNLYNANGTGTAGAITIGANSTATFSFTNLGVNNNNAGADTINGGTVALGAVVDGRSQSNTGAPSTTSGLIINGGNVTATSVHISTSNSGGDLNVTGGNFVIGNSTTTGGFSIGAGSSTTRGGFLTMTGGSLTYLGTDGLLLSTTDTFGVASITGGTALLTGVTVNSGNVAGATSSLTVSGGASLYLGSVGLLINSPSSTVFVSVGNGTIGALAPWTSAAPITLSNTTIGATFQTSDNLGNPNNITLSGTLSGAGTLVATGSGVLTIAGSNTYTGTTVINSGTLQVGSGSTAGNLANGAITDNSSLVFDRSNTYTPANPISGPGTVTMNGTGTTTMSGNNTYTGGTILNSGTLGFTKGLGTGAVTFNSGSLQWGANTTTDITGTNQLIITSLGGTLNTGGNNVTLANGANLTGTGAMTKAGNGSLVLGSGVNATSGGVNVNGGTLEVGSGSQLNTGAVTAVGGTLSVDTSSTISGVLTVGAGGNLTLGQAGSGSGNFIALNLGSNLIVNSGATLNFDLSNASGNDTIDVASALNVTGGTSSVGFNFYAQNGSQFLTPGTYELINFASLAGNSTSFYALQNAQQGTFYSFDTTSNPDFVTLTVTSTAPSFNWVTGSGNWSLASNWVSPNFGTPPPNAAEETATFDTFSGGTGGTVTLDQAATLGSVRFNGTVANSTSTVSYTIASDGNPAHVLTLDNGAGNSAAVTDFAGNHTLGVPIVLNSSLAVSTSNVGDTLTISGNISDSGAHSLTVNGSGTVALSGTNTYAGGTTLNSGILNFTNGALGLSPGTLTFNGGTLQWAAGNTQDISSGYSVGFTSLGAILDPGNNTVTLANPIGGNSTGSLTKAGANGTLILTGTNTFTGPVNLNAGTLQFSTLSNLGAGTSINFNGGSLQWAPGSSTDISTSTVTFNAGNGTLDTNGNNVTLVNPIGNNGSGGFTKAGNGILTLLGVNTYSGPTVLKAGTIQINSTSSLGTGILTFGNGTLEPITNNLTSTRNITLATGATGTVQVDDGSNFTISGVISGAGNLNFTDNITPVLGSNLTLTAASSFTGNLVINTGTLTDTNAQSSLNPTVSGLGNPQNGNHTVTVNNGGTLIFDAAGGNALGNAGSTVLMNTVINAGGTVENILGNAAIGPVTLNGGNLTASAASGGSQIYYGVYQLGGTITVGGTSPSLISSANTTSAINLTIGVNATQRTFNVADVTGDANTDLTVSGILGDSSNTANLTAGLIKTGAGTMALTANNIYSYITTISNGVLTTGATGRLANGGTSSSIGESSNASTNLVLDGGTLQYANTGAAESTDRLFTLTVNGGTLDASGGNTITFAGNGANAIAYSGNGTRNLTLTGTNTGANILAPILADSPNGNVTSATSLTKSGVGAWTITGNNTYSGGTTINSGTLQVGNGGSSGTIGTGAVVDNSTLAFNRSDSAYNVANAISGTGAVTMNGTGAVTLSSANTYSNGTTINSGTLILTNTTGSGTGSGLVQVNSGGALAGTGTASGAVTLAAGGALTAGVGQAVGNLSTGTLTLSANAGPLTSALNFYFGGGVNSEVLDSGDLDINGGGVNLYQAGSANPLLATGIYDLVQYGGNLNGDPTQLTVLNNPNLGLTYTFSDTAGSNGDLVLTVGGTFATGTWTASGGGAWNTAGNWANNAVPNSVGQVINFGAFITSNSTVTVDGPETVGALIFNYANFNYTLAASTGNLTLDNSSNSAAALITVGSGNETVSAPLILANALGANVTVTAGNSLTLSGPISETPGAGAVLAFNGPGLLVLNGTNSFTGGVVLNSGTLNFNSQASFGTPGNLTLNAGTLQWATNSTTDISANGAVVGINGGVSFDTNGNNVTIANAIGNNGAGNLTKVGNGILALLGNNTYTGGTVVNQGTLNFNSLASLGTATTLTINAATLQWATGSNTDISADTVTFGSGGVTLDTNGSNVTLANPIGNSGAGNLTKVGNGILALAANNTYTGTTTITNGNLSISSDLNLGPALTAVKANALVINGGTLQTTANFTLSSNRSVFIGANNGTISPAGGTGLTYGGVISGGVLTKTGNGNLSLSAANTFNGTIINAGAIELTNSTGLGAGTITINGGTLGMNGGLTIANAMVVPLGANATLTVASNSNSSYNGLVSGSGTLNFSQSGGGVFSANSQPWFAGFNGTLNINGSMRMVGTGDHGFYNTTVNLGSTGFIALRDGGTDSIGALFGLPGSGLSPGTAASTWAIGGEIGGLSADSSFGGGIGDTSTTVFTSLIKQGNGTLTLYGGESYSGTTTISAGTLQIGNGGSVGTFGTGNISDAGTLAFNRSDNALSMANIISGAGTVETVGSGTVTLTGLSTYTGPTDLNGGTLSVASLPLGGVSGPIGASSNVASNLVFNGGSLQYTGPTATTDRSFTLGTNGGTLDASGTTIGSTGVLTYGNTNSVSFATGAGPATLTLTGNNTGANTLNAVIVDNGGNATSLVKNGPGLWVLPATNTYTGTTTVNQGTLEPAALGNSPVTINGGILAGPSTLGGSVTVNNGGLLIGAVGVAGAGTTIAGGVTVNSGGNFTGVGNTTVLGTVTVTSGGNLTPSSAAFGNTTAVVGNLTAGNLTANNGAALDFIFGTTSLYDEINVTNTLEIDSTVGVSLLTTGLSPWTFTGNYDLFNFGSFTGSVNNLLVSNTQAGLSYAFSEVGNSIFLQIANSGGLNSWNGTGGGSWTNGTLWTNNAVPSPTATDTFFSSILGNSTITLDANQKANGLQFGSAFSYTITQGNGAWSLELSNATDPVNDPAEVDVLAGNHTIAAPIVLTAGGLTGNVESTISTLTISGVIGQTAMAGLSNNGTGTLELDGLNTYTGVTTLNGGTLAVQTLANGGVPSGIGASSNATSNLVFNGGSLRYLGAGNSTDRLFTLGPSGGTIRSSGTGPLNFTNPGALALQASNMSTTLTLSGNNTGANTFAPIIVDNPLGNTTGLTKSGSGLWAVTGNGTQTGVTTISGGTLQISSIANGGVVQTALNLYGPSNLTTTANTTTGDTVVGVSDASNLTDGQVASGLGIPNGTTITDVDYTNNLVTLSMAVTSNSTSGASVTFAGLAIANMTTDISGVTPGEVLVGPGLSTGTVVTNIDLVDNALILNQAPFQTNLNEVNLNTFTANPLGGSTNDPSNLIINGGTLQYVGPAGSTDRLFTVGSANATVDSSGTGALNFTNPGSLTFNGTASSVLTLTGNAAAVNTFAPVIGDPVSGNTSVVTSGTTTWMLTGLNTYSGGTTITGGTLQISSDSNLGTGNLTVGNGTAEYLLGFTSTRNISLTSANSTILVDSGQALTLNGNISGTGTLNFNGVGTLGGTNTYSGGTFLNGNVTLTSVTGLGTGSTTLENGSTLIEPNATTAGTGLGVNLIVATGATANFTFTSNASASYSGLLSGSNSSVLNLTAASSPLTLSGTTSQFANFTGTLNVLAVGSAGLRIFNSGTYTGFANMTLNLENTTGALFDHNTGQTVVIGNLSGNPGSQLNGDNSGTAGNTTWQIGGLNGTSTFAGNITDSGASNHSILNKVGTGILTLTGNNTFAGNATFTGGEVNFGSLTNLGTGILNFNGGGLQWATSSNTDISTRTVNFSTGGAVLDTNGNDVTLANAIGNGGAGGLTKIGNGNLFLNHAESYSGNTTISVGNIVLDVPGVLPTSSNVTVGSGAILNVNGQNATIGSLSGAGNVSLGSGSLTTGGNNLSPTFAGTISGVADGGLIKNGTGVLTLSGTSTYVGPTLVNAGNLDLTGTLSSSPVTVANGAILNGNGTIGGNLTLNQGGKISLGGPIANTLTVGNFTWNATSTTPGMQFSLTDTSSTLDILGNFTRGSSSGLGQYVFDFQGSGFFSGVYTLIDFGSVDPAFTLSDFSYVNLGTNESGAFSINANSLTFNIAPIPEPATWTLLIGAASLLAVWRKRRKGVR